MNASTSKRCLYIPIVLVLSTFLSLAAAETPNATKYLALVSSKGKTADSPITVQLTWTCSSYTGWKLVRRYCDNSKLCSSGCPARVEDSKRTRRCCNETQTQCRTDTEVHSQKVGCCSATYCVEPNEVKPTEVRK